MSLGRLAVDLVANAGKFISDMGRASAALHKDMGSMQRSAKRASKSIVKSTAQMAGGFVGTAGVLVAMRQSVQQAKQFKTAMAEVSTLLKDTSGVDKLTKSVRSLSRQYGREQTETAKALYQIISAGATDSAQAVGILDAAIKLSIGGVTDVATAADGLTSVMNAYGREAGSATNVSDAMFVAMKAGKTTIGELSENIGQVAKFAQVAGVSLEELLSATAALTLGGISTSEAMTQIRSVLAAVTKQTKQSQDAAKELGLDFSLAGIRAKGFAGFLTEIKEKAGGNDRALADLFGRVEGLMGIFALTDGPQAQAMKDTLDAMTQKSGETSVAFGKMSEDAQFAFDRGAAAARDMAINLGSTLIETLQPALILFADNVEAIASALIIAAQVAAAYVAVFVVLPALYTAATVEAMAFAMALAAQNVGFVASIKNIGLMKTAASGLFALWAGWKIGTWARENFLEVRLAGIAMIGALMNGWERLKEVAGIVWAGIKSAVTIQITAIMTLWAKSLKAAAGFAAKFGADKIAAGFDKLAKSVTPAASAIEIFNGEVAAIKKESAAARAKITELTDDMVDFELVAEGAGAAVAGAAGALGDMGQAGSDAATVINHEIGPAVESLIDDFEKQVKATHDARVSFEKLIDDLQFEREILNLSNREREIQVAIRRANVSAASAEADQIRKVVGALFDERAALNAASAAALTHQQTAGGMVDSLARVMGDFMTGTIKGWKGLWSEVKNIFRNAISDLIAMWVRSGITNMLSTLFGGGGGGFGGGGVFGGGGGGSGLLQNLASGAALPILGAIGGGIYGLSQGSGGASSLLAGASYAGLGYVGGVAAAGAISGAAGSVAAGAGAGAGALAGASGALTAVPVIGWIVAIAAALDAITGGGLFGTRYRPESATGTISTAEGGTATLDIIEKRKRSLFRGTRRRTVSQDPGEEARQAAQDLFDSVEGVMTAAAQAIGGSAPEVLEAAIRTVQEFDKKGRVKSTQIFVDILGRSWEEATQELASARISGEAIISAIDQVLGGDDATRIAERWRDSAEALLAGSQFLLRAQVDLHRGVGLLNDGGLVEVVALVDELAAAGETMDDTYTRLLQGVTVFNSAMEAAGILIENTGAEIVRFSAQMVTAAGGLDEMTRLWNVFISSYVDPLSAATQNVERLGLQAGEALEGIGLDATTTMDQFRAAFEAALPSLTPDDVVTWLRAGEALAVLGRGMTDLDQALAQIAQAYEDQRTAAREYVSFLTDILLATEGMDPTGFIRDTLELARAQRDAEDAANQLARAAGREGASVAELALIHRSFARQLDALVRQLETSIRDLSTDLYGSELSAIEAEIARIEANTTSSVENIGQAIDNTMADWLRGVEGINDFLNGMLLGSVSPLTPAQQLSEAQRQFDTLAAAAAGGDVEALSKLPGAAQTLLDLGRSFWASGEAYQTLFGAVRAALTEAQTGAPDVGVSTGAVNTVAGINASLSGLFARRDELLAAQNAQERMWRGQDLATQLVTLANATGEDIFDLAERLGVPIDQLAEDLGILPQDMPGFFDDLGEDLAAVQTELAALSDLQQSMLDAIDAQEATTLAVDALAPILLTPPVADPVLLQSTDRTAVATEGIFDILNRPGGTVGGRILRGSFAQGASNISQDGLYRLHQGEAVVPAGIVRFLGAGAAAGAPGSTADQIARLREDETQTRELLQEIINRLVQIESATVDGNESVSSGIERGNQIAELGRGAA